MTSPTTPADAVLRGTLRRSGPHRGIPVVLGIDLFAPLDRESAPPWASHVTLVDQTLPRNPEGYSVVMPRADSASHAPG
jgi:hypothetical protein